jgi:hypothetical protein
MGMLLVLLLGLQEATEGGRTLIVHMRDGSTVPLKSWALSIEYETWAEGEGPASATILKKASQSFIVGKKEYPLSGFSSIDMDYAGSPAVRGLALHGKGGALTRLKVEPPSRELFAAGKGKVVVPRGLDLVGETILGTKKDICLLSYSSFVECGSEPQDQVQSLEFTE